MGDKTKGSQIPLRNAVHRALHEIVNTDGVPVEHRDSIRQLRKSLRTEARPWSQDCRDGVQDVLRACSNTMGDIAIWNKGGQGYTAMVRLRKARATKFPETIEVTLRAPATVEAKIRIPIPTTAANPVAYAHAQALERAGECTWEISDDSLTEADIEVVDTEAV